MGFWKELVYSGSNAFLNNVVASTVSGSMSGSFSGNGSGLTNIPSASYSNTSSFVTTTFSRGITLDNSSGISTTGSYIIWRAPYACRIINIYGKKVGSGTPQINARRSSLSGYQIHTGSNLYLTGSDVWRSVNDVSSSDYIPGESLEIIVTGSGATQICVQLDFNRI